MLYRVLLVGKRTTLVNIHYKALAKAAGIVYEITDNGKKALETLSNNQFDLLITGITTTGINGFELIEAVRSREMDIPIMVVSKRNSDNDIIRALDLGADDYHVVPLNPVIFIAKLKSLIRRYHRSTRVASNQSVEAGPFLYNNANLKLYKNGVEIPMSSKENAIMKMFIDNVDKTFSKEMIHDTIWGESPVDENKIMVYINRIRAKIEEDPSRPKHLVTIRNIGYRFKA